MRIIQLILGSIVIFIVVVLMMILWGSKLKWISVLIMTVIISICAYLFFKHKTKYKTKTKYLPETFTNSSSPPYPTCPEDKYQKMVRTGFVASKVFSILSAGSLGVLIYYSHFKLPIESYVAYLLYLVFVFTMTWGIYKKWLICMVLQFGGVLYTFIDMIWIGVITGSHKISVLGFVIQLIWIWFFARGSWGLYKTRKQVQNTVSQ